MRLDPTYRLAISSIDENDDIAVSVRDEQSMKQMQVERHEVNQQEKRSFEQDRLEAIRLQDFFDQEDTRERQATLEYVKGLDEAVRLQEEERDLLEQANLEHAARTDHECMVQQDREFAQELQMKLTDLDHERSVQCDREYAQKLQLELDSEPASAYPTGAPLVEPSLLNIKNARNPSDPFMEHSIPDWMQNLWDLVSRDRALAEVSQGADQQIAGKEKAECKELIAWQKVSEASDVRKPSMDKAAITAAKRKRAKPTVEIEQAKTQNRPAQRLPLTQAVPQTFTAQAAQAATANDVAGCGICGDSLPKTQLVKPCEHSYCRKCLAGWFLRALKEKPKKRPRCCKRDLPVNLVAHHLGPTFVEDYTTFELEISTPNPLYCSFRNCSAFVPRSRIHGDVGICKCGGRNCRHCRRREHAGKLCAQDQDTQRVEALGKKQGWKHCPHCKHMIERTAGCLHMTCSQCRTEFCWKCLKRICKGEGACR